MKQQFKDGSVLLTGEELRIALEATINRRGAYDIDCSFCRHEDDEEHCKGCTIADWETSCSCHISPPCSKCVGSKFESTPYLINYVHHKSHRDKWECFKGDEATFEKVEKIENSGLRLSAETLSTGEVAMYIDDGVERDYEIEICAKADFKQTMCKMVKKFLIPNKDDNTAPASGGSDERINREDNLKEDRRLEVGRGPLRVT